MHFAAEDYGRHELMNWGFVPLCAAVRDDPESHDTLYGELSTAEICHHRRPVGKMQPLASCSGPRI
jgi:hypothetical protein